MTNIWLDRRTPTHLYNGIDYRYNGSLSVIIHGCKIKGPVKQLFWQHMTGISLKLTTQVQNGLRGKIEEMNCSGTTVQEYIKQFLQYSVLEICFRRAVENNGSNTESLFCLV